MVPYFTGEQYKYIIRLSNTPKGMVVTSKYIRYNKNKAVAWEYSREDLNLKSMDT